MHLIARHRFDVPGGQVSDIAIGDAVWWLLEREWRHNLPNVSCVPRGTYSLEPHSSTKYPSTFALVGDTVAHYLEPAKPRSACVIHSAGWPSDLAGCLAICEAVSPLGMAIHSKATTEKFLAMLNPEQSHSITMY